jgi:hypothetical protein
VVLISSLPMGTSRSISGRLYWQSSMFFPRSKLQKTSEKLKTCASWCIAENWRFLDSIAFAKEEASKLGRILGFRVRTYDNIQQDWKFFRKFFLFVLPKISRFILTLLI